MASSLNNRNIIMVGQQPWDVAIGSNAKDIALELSKNNRVLYVNSPLDRITSIRNRKDASVKKRLRIIAKKDSGIVQIGENLWNLYPDCIVESVNWISSSFIFNIINRSNNKKFAASIQKALSDLEFDDFILFNDNEIIKSFYLKEFLNPKISIYYSRDYILATAYWKKHGERLEPILIKKSDVCVANSVYLRDYCLRYNKSSYYIGQGCDLEIFKNFLGEAPDDLPKIKKPIIGYVGAILTSRLDIEILSYLAMQCPECDLVLVGPEDENFKNSDLHGFKNVFFLGPKLVEQLPAYIAAFDVCINPQVINQLTIGNYPRKIDEYLAMGKPVVATNTKAMETFKDFVYLADDKDDYVHLVQKALTENTLEQQQERVIFASGHTWQNSIALMGKAVDDFQLKKSKKITSNNEQE